MDYRLNFMRHLSGREFTGICDYGKTTVNEFPRRFRNRPKLCYPLLWQPVALKPANKITVVGSLTIATF